MSTLEAQCSTALTCMKCYNINGLLEQSAVTGSPVTFTVVARLHTHIVQGKISLLMLEMCEAHLSPLVQFALPVSILLPLLAGHICAPSTSADCSQCNINCSPSQQDLHRQHLQYSQGHTPSKRNMPHIYDTYTDQCMSCNQGMIMLHAEGITV